MLNEWTKKLGEERSIIRELFEEGKTLKQKLGKDKVFDFSIGNPSVPVPKIVNESIIRILGEKSDLIIHGYSSAEGDINVRDSIAKYMNEKYNANADKSLIYLTSGAAAALTISIKAITNKDDEIIVLAPYFPEYAVFIKNAGAKVVVSKPNEENFHPDFLDLENKITNRTKAIIINSPNNPTGVFYNKNTIKKIVDIVNKKQTEYNSDIYIISDEPYRELLYVDEEYCCINNYYDNSIITYSFSKSLSLPGERIGYILVNGKCKSSKELFNSICGAGRSMGYVCATTLFQQLIPYVLGKTSDFSIYVKNKNFLKKELEELGYKVVNPDGAFYIFMKSPIDDAIEFSKIALKHNLILVPSDSFGIKGYVRIAYCQDYEMIVKSIDAFKKLKEDVG